MTPKLRKTSASQGTAPAASRLQRGEQSDAANPLLALKELNNFLTERFPTNTRNPNTNKNNKETQDFCKTYLRAVKKRHSTIAWPNLISSFTSFVTLAQAHKNLSSASQLDLLTTLMDMHFYYGRQANDLECLQPIDAERANTVLSDYLKTLYSHTRLRTAEDRESAWHWQEKDAFTSSTLRLINSLKDDASLGDVQYKLLNATHPDIWTNSAEILFISCCINTILAEEVGAINTSVADNNWADCANAFTLLQAKIESFLSTPDGNTLKTHHEWFLDSQLVEKIIKAYSRTAAQLVRAKPNNAQTLQGKLTALEKCLKVIIKHDDRSATQYKLTIEGLTAQNTLMWTQICTRPLSGPASAKSFFEILQHANAKFPQLKEKLKHIKHEIDPNKPYTKTASDQPQYILHALFPLMNPNHLAQCTEAARHELFNIVLELWPGALELNPRDANNNTPLMTAAENIFHQATQGIKALNNWYQNIQALIKAGADIDATNNQEQTAFDLFNQAGITALKDNNLPAQEHATIAYLLENIRSSLAPKTQDPTRDIEITGNSIPIHEHIAHNDPVDSPYESIPPNITFNYNDPADTFNYNDPADTFNYNDPADTFNYNKILNAIPRLHSPLPTDKIRQYNNPTLGLINVSVWSEHAGNHFLLPNSPLDHLQKICTLRQEKNRHSVFIGDYTKALDDFFNGKVKFHGCIPSYSTTLSAFITDAEGNPSLLRVALASNGYDKNDIPNFVALTMHPRTDSAGVAQMLGETPPAAQASTSQLAAQFPQLRLHQ